MSPYKEMYTTVFNACTDALRQIEAAQLQLAEAHSAIVAAQQKAEELFMAADEQASP